MTASPAPRRAVSQQDGALCEVCRRPLPARHHHVLDTERCAIFCTCPDCSAAVRRAADTRTARPLRVARAHPGAPRLPAPRPKTPRAG